MLPHLLSRARSVAASLVIAFTAGCGTINQSLHVESTVLVKVPITGPIAEPTPKASADGWEFRHVLQAPTDKEHRGQWYVAWNKEKPLHFGGLVPSWGRLFSRAPEISTAVFKAFHQYPVVIEPNRTFVSTMADALAEGDSSEQGSTENSHGKKHLKITALPIQVWSDNRTADDENPGQFVIDPMWHLDKKHSQLAAAREEVGGPPGEGIVIGHLDNGLDARHPAAPPNLAHNDWRANAVGLLQFARGERGKPPPPQQVPEATHGLGTSGILAGGEIEIGEKKVRGGRIKAYKGLLGGAPYATVVPVRVAPWVFSVGTAELAYALDYASRKQKADVISMSHGGSPTHLWADAVNAAYERGTAMFAAESDFLSFMPDPFPPNGFILPASPVYPAAFRRVVGVTGVTADYRSYGRNTLSRLLRNPLKLVQWMLRGSYGADGTSTVLFRPSRKPDPSQTKSLGQLRPYPIAAYSPNIPWLTNGSGKDGKTTYGIRLTGSGTSASTPQVAAAAALWLQKHRREFSYKEWHQWQKVEAVYYALLKSADQRGKGGPDKYLGAGLLRAKDALAISYADAKKAKAPRAYHNPEDVPRNSLWYGHVGRDYFDGARSALSFFGLHTHHPPDQRHRAKLEEQPKPNDTEVDALERLYYNMMLLREWHGGDIPRDTDEARYRERAKRKAGEAARSRVRE